MQIRSLQSPDMRAHTVAWALGFTLAVLAAGCVDRLKVTDRGCPCAAGWTCCDDVCIPGAHCGPALDATNRNGDAEASTPDLGPSNDISGDIFSGDSWAPLSDAAISAGPWAVVAGASGADRLKTVAVDYLGNTLIGGYCNGDGVVGEKTLTAKTREPLVASIDPTGKVKWVVTGVHDDDDLTFGEINGIVVDGAGNSYVVGSFSDKMTFGTTKLSIVHHSNLGNVGDVFVAKLDSAGGVLWAKVFGGKDYDDGEGIALDSRGNIIVVGSFQHRVEFGSVTLTSKGGDDLFVAKLTSDGGVLWAHSAGGLNDECGFKCAVTVDRANNIYVLTDYQDIVTFGATELTAQGDEDLAVVKYDAAGGVEWATGAGGPGGEHPEDIAVDGKGNTYITGWLNPDGAPATFGSTVFKSLDQPKLFLAQLTPQGDFSWALAGESRGSSSAGALAVDAAGNGWLVGQFGQLLDFGGKQVGAAGRLDVFVARFDALGKVKHIKTMGGKGTEKAHAVACDRLGRCYVAGTATETLTINGETVTIESKDPSSSWDDGLVWRSDP